MFPDDLTFPTSLNSAKCSRFSFKGAMISEHINLPNLYSWFIVFYTDKSNRKQHIINTNAQFQLYYYLYVHLHLTLKLFILHVSNP